ncbi:LysM peptidoglycan-binding domain-containing protein [Metabacillus bambusae]|uniref:LysM peptidoglycan-binding domain-containing protein n=1 Tax=Metabacillus bambusae TaxID=2795218 RepID=A0ABS3NA88_9BACI|nr:LysM domain-containing protein [Metabacillus bambusae]MBO1514899.1 LysM peptidoglycan-binding domain-containing protein [Metabacillus bambusae]
MNNITNGGFGYIIQPGDNYWLLAQRYHTTIEEIFAVNPRVNPYYLRVGQQITIPVSQPSFQYARQNHCISQAAVDLMSNNRSLWEEHVAWTRMTIISLTFKLPDIDFVIARLLQNATDMGEMIRPLYGVVAANKYAALIKEHLIFAADLVKAALAGDEQAAMTAEKKWYANADEIAVFLSSINRFLPEEEVRAMFYRHLDLTKQEAVYMIKMDYQKDIEIYDEIEEQAREMADTISEAMVKLYPNMFR